MAGIYLHIPFCKKACHYCDFHFSTSAAHKQEMIRSLKSEILLRQDYLEGETVNTVYFGGGTPSVLSSDEIKSLLELLQNTFPIDPNAEISLEANPDDLSATKVRELRNTPLNRFSIGIQSFFEEDLIWMNRAHNAVEADASIKRVQDAGFENITADLIYGYPLLTDEKWLSNIRTLLALEIPHISSYSMTIEPRTAFASLVKQGRQAPMDENQSAAQFQILMDELETAGFEHYEISNFCRPGAHSRHNSNYWAGVPYLGIGPSAHSFNGKSRQWNVANNAKYITALTNNLVPFEQETLSLKDQLNEYIMTSLRTSKGMDMDLIASRFGSEYPGEFSAQLSEFSEKGWIESRGSIVILSREGKLFADHIAGELFVTDIPD